MIIRPSEPNTPVDRLTNGTNQIKLMIQREYASLNRLLNQAGQWMWNNPLKKTPQEVADSFGTDSTELFRLSNLLATMMGQITGEPVVIMPPNYDVSFNEDGTVVITLQDSSSSVSSVSSESSSGSSASSASSASSETPVPQESASSESSESSQPA